MKEVNLPAAMPFVEARGYAELERYRTSVQIPSKVDLSGLDALRSRLEAKGIETVAFPAIDSPAAREELYRSTLPIWRDMPHEAHVDSLFNLTLPAMPATVTPLVYAIPVQLIAYHTAAVMGKDVDQPRSLAKSVPVE